MGSRKWTCTSHHHLQGTYKNPAETLLRLYAIFIEHLLQYVHLDCSPGTVKKYWIFFNVHLDLKRNKKREPSVWHVVSVKWGIYAEQTFYTYHYSDPKRDVMKAYQYTRSLEILESAAQWVLCNLSARLVGRLYLLGCEWQIRPTRN
jgi:hypothetical protein